jgi:hypothetical protein
MIARSTITTMTPAAIPPILAPDGPELAASDVDVPDEEPVAVLVRVAAWLPDVVECIVVDRVIAFVGLDVLASA